MACQTSRLSTTSVDFAEQILPTLFAGQFLDVFCFPDSYSLKTNPLSHRWASSYFSLRSQSKCLCLQEALLNLNPFCSHQSAEYSLLLIERLAPRLTGGPLRVGGLCPPASAIDSLTGRFPVCLLAASFSCI